MNAKKAVEELTAGKTIEESSGQKIGAFTGNWWTAFLSSFGAASSTRYGGMQYADYYNFSDARQDDTRNAIRTLAMKDSQGRINSAYAALGKARTDVETGRLSRISGVISDRMKRIWMKHSGQKNGTVHFKGGRPERSRRLPAFCQAPSSFPFRRLSGRPGG